MATYSMKARHDVDAKDWLAAITAASQGNKTYEGSREVLDELDNVHVPPYSKPFVSVKGRKYKLKDNVSPFVWVWCETCI